MTFRERVLYHQIHPVKLATDWLSGIGAAMLLWQHRLLPALLLGLLPPIAVSAVLLRYADLEPYRASALGRYVARFMTRRVEAGRLAGLLLVWGGAWLRRPVLIAVGFVIILGCWLYGLLPSRPED
jgi:hypothetical protein